MNRRERSRAENSLLLIAGLYHTFEQWTRVLIPFFQWRLVPKPNFDTILILGSLSAVFTALGSFLVAQMIESFGVKKTAIVSTLATASYQILVCQVEKTEIFTCLQVLLLFNHIPMIIDATICQLEGEDGDDKKRTRLIGRMTVPQSIAYAIGPYLALQTILLLSHDVLYSQIVCATLHFVTTIPVIIVALPEHQKYKPITLPSLSSYWYILQNERTRLCLTLLMFVTGPYHAYDQVIRTHLASSIIPNPTNMIYVFLILGGTTILTNLILLPKIQTTVAPQKVLITTFATLFISYLYLSFASDFISLLVGLCVQVAVVSIAVGELSSQVLSTIGKHESGKVAALLRLINVIAFALTPLLTGMHIRDDELGFLCYCSATVSALAIPIVYRYGQYMRSHPAYLPMTEMNYEKFD